MAANQIIANSCEQRVLIAGVRLIGNHGKEHGLLVGLKLFLPVLQHAKMEPRSSQDGAKMAPRWPQEGPKMAPRRPRQGPKGWILEG